MLGEGVATSVLFAALAIIAIAMPVQNDTWWHLRSGLETVDGLSPFVDRFSWTVTGTFFWNHSWLSQVLFSQLHRAGGFPLLTAVCAATVVGTWWLVWRRCRGDELERAVLVAAAIPVVTSTWSVRPQIAIVLLPVVVALVASNRAVATAFVMALWANLHGGFALGVVVLGAGIAAAAVFDRQALPRRAVVAAAGTVATLATPLGWINWREILASMERSHANEIIEWRPPGFDGVNLVFWAFGALFLALLTTRWRRLDSAYLQVSAAAACVALLSATQAVRNVPAFMMLALPPLSALLFRPHVVAVPAKSSTSGRRWAVGIWAFVGVVASWTWRHPTERMDWYPMGRDAQSAIAACDGPLFNTYEQGGPIIWFVPSQPVLVDSRQDPYPVPLVQQAAHVTETGDYRDLFESRGINCAVLPPWSPAVRVLAAGGWRQTHADGRWVVLERP